MSGSHTWLLPLKLPSGLHENKVSVNIYPSAHLAKHTAPAITSSQSLVSTPRVAGKEVLFLIHILLTHGWSDKPEKVPPNFSNRPEAVHTNGQLKSSNIVLLHFILHVSPKTAVSHSRSRM